MITVALVREPLKVKRRRKAIDKTFNDVLREKPANISAAKLLEASRR